MRRIFVSLLVIFVTNQQVTAQLPISFDDIQTIFKWSYQIYQTGNVILNPDKTKENVAQILADVEKLSSDLGKLDAKLDKKLDVVLETLLRDFEIQSDLQGPKRKLSDYLDIVDRIFESSNKYKFNQSYSDTTLEKFADTVLWGENSLPNTLENIYHLINPGATIQIVPGITTLMLRSSWENLQIDCNNFISAQQRLHYIFIEIIMAEMKAFIALKNVFTTMQSIDRNGRNYTSDLAESRDKFEIRVYDYFKIFIRDMANMPRLIRRCDENLSQRGDDFLEFQKYSRSAVFDVKRLTDQGCPLECPHNSKLGVVSESENPTIYDCETITDDITICPPEPGSSRSYLWWTTKDNIVRGHQSITGECDRGTSKIHGSLAYVTLMAPRIVLCPLCVCSVDLNKAETDNSDAVFRISVTDQISNIQNNMVVTGIKFVTYENALHLQIKHATMSNGGVISKNNEWKSLHEQCNSTYSYQKNAKLRYESLRHDHKSLYLDDIKVPDNYVITGVRFALVNNSGFMLQVHAMPFVLKTGELELHKAQWFDATTHPLRPQDYKRKRFEITMENADDPTRGNLFKYDVESNKIIKITHTDVKKDAGQTTIPYIDSRSLETIPPFPLSAIGMFFRSCNGCGGHIVPRIFTINITSSMEASLQEYSKNLAVKDEHGTNQGHKYSQPINVQNSSCNGY